MELVKVNQMPRDRWIRPEWGFALFASLIDWRVDILEVTAYGIIHYLWPGLIGLTKRYRVGVARPASSTECLVGQFCDVRPAHHDRHSRGADRIGHAVGFGNHSRHRANTNESNFLFTHKPRYARLIHWLCVAIHQHHLMARRSQRLEKKHPKMRHEIVRHTVVRVIQ